MSQLKNEIKEKLIAVILCAGEGKRLKKLAKDIPKPLLKLKILENKSILQNTIFKLVKLGIEQIVIIIGHLGTVITDYISKLLKNNILLQNKLTIINSENQYKFGPLYSFLSITKNKTIYKDKNSYLLIPGDTIFDFHLLNQVLFIISNNYNLLVKHPFVFYRTIEQQRLREKKKRNLIISNAELDTTHSEIILERISQLKIRKGNSETTLNEIIPIFTLNYDSINEILNIKDLAPFTTVWEALNYIISIKKKVIAFSIKSNYQFFDIDDKYDLKKLKNKEKDNRCSDSMGVDN